MPQPKEPGPMLAWEEDVEAAALRARGWSIAAIARHLGRTQDDPCLPGRGARPRAAPVIGAGWVRPVRGLRGRPVDRGPPRVGDRAVRRGRCVGLPGQLSHLHPGAADPGPASPLRGVRRREGPRDRPDRPSAGGGDAVGLGGAARRAVGWHRLRAGRGAVVLQPGPRGPQRGPGSAAPGGGAGRGGAPLRRADPPLAG
jgi:hypothetical protein